MTPEQIDHFRRKLQSRLDAVDQRIARAGQHAREPVEDLFGEPGDEPDHDLLAATNLDMGELFTREREDIEEALLRIELGEYGICEECGKPIELDRLEAAPTARFCKLHAPRHEVQRPPKL
ncbi:MAG: TraR/DksA family transcriptional regulator [Candidatus Binatia bacterium]